ncbi:MAG: excinuclease ABC subunit C [Deltaproteobacteria bacterium]|nr:excinuclease ABC subunit C [Deltaproteobacteria bacterium]
MNADTTAPSSLVEQVERLPTEPGVYLFKSGQGAVLYVGKAQSLKSRVRQYVSGGDGRIRIPALVQRSTSVEVVVTGNVKEALLLENELIKQHRPPFNVRLRDDKQYLALRIDESEAWPRVTMVRRFRKDGAQYFGPYTSSVALKASLTKLSRLFPLRSCTNANFKDYARRGRPCVEYEMKRCLGPCCGLTTEAAYAEQVRGTVLFLRGRSRELVEKIEQEMATAAAEERFEDAARLRDRIQAVERTIEGQQIVTEGGVDRDVFGLARQGGEVEVQVLHVREGRVIGAARVLVLERPARRRRGHELLPRSVLRRGGGPRAAAGDPDLGRARRRRRPRRPLARALRAAGRGPPCPARGAAPAGRDRRAQRDPLPRLAPRRPGEHRHRDRRAGRALRARDSAGPDRVLRRLEPPGHAGGREPGRVRARGAGDCRLSAVSHAGGGGGDDYACMREMLDRRLKRVASEPLPDLLMVDGGRGQLAVVSAALADAGLEVEILGISKERDTLSPSIRVKRSGGLKAERIFRPGRTNPIQLAPSSRGMLLLQRVRDESHRFAIEYQRDLRSRLNMTSILEELPGIGPGKRRALLKGLGSLRGVRLASEETLAAVPGISPKDARSIRAFFDALTPLGEEAAAGGVATAGGDAVAGRDWAEGGPAAEGAEARGPVATAQADGSTMGDEGAGARRAEAGTDPTEAEGQAGKGRDEGA